MGLDMYLYAEEYISGWDHNPNPKFPSVVELSGFPVAPGSQHIEIRTCVAYWRKANHIHKWFIDNVADGADECRDHWVSNEQLRELLTVCEAVIDGSELIEGTVDNGTIYDAEHPQGAVILEQGRIVKDPTLAHKLLPTQSGFFFGSTDYDEYYMHDVVYTATALRQILDNPLSEKVDFYYRPSW